MKELVLDLVTSYENRISVVEGLVTGAYYTTANLDESLVKVTEERAGLKASLQEILARNCSLRRKDFNVLMESLIAEFEKRKRELDEERKLIRDELKRYVDEQKQSAGRLRQQVVELSYGNKDALEVAIARVKAAYQNKGQQVFALLRDFQLRLEVFRREQEALNHELQRLVERGESLRLEDLRQLEAAKDGQERKGERKLRRQEVERLLAYFKGQRQEGTAMGGSKS